MSSSLKVIATPIGNVRDITLRAMDEIKKADVILAEDTRHSMRLIKALGLELKKGCRMISCDSHKEQNRIELVASMLMANEQVVFLSDAGCPAISDPGSLLVKGVLEKGCEVVPIPGPSAHSAALMAAGIDTTRFSFLGFLPKKKSLRKKMVMRAESAGLALIIYESIQRLQELLSFLYEHLGQRRVVVARELTKLHETFHRGTLGCELTPPLVVKGECVVVVELKREKAGDHIPPAGLETGIGASVQDFIGQELSLGHSAKDVVTVAAQKFSIKKRVAYELVLKIRDGEMDQS
jgi:16S rRNA (cytidine1402-2'-O)-methyltransferase